MTMPAPRLKPHPRKAARPLGLEVLEDRTLLSSSPATAAWNAAILPAASTVHPADHILVRFRSDALVNGQPAALGGTTIEKKLDLVDGLFEVQLSGNISVATALAAYRADHRVLAAEADVQLAAAWTPNDARYGQQADLHNTGQRGATAGDDIRSEQAWSVTTGSRRTIVAVLDTGIDYDHLDLYQNIWINQAEIPTSRRVNLIDVDHDGLITFADLNDPRNQGVGKITDINHDGRIDAADILAPMVKDRFGRDTGLGGWADGISEDGDTAHVDDLVGWNFVNNTNNPYDDNGHGTHVSGTIGASGNNGIGIAGVAWQVSLMGLKFLNANGNGGIGQFIGALDYAVKHGARISNNSWSGASNSQILYDAIDNARARGHIFVAAAGNDGHNNDQTPAYPSSFNLDNIIAVAATDNSDRLANFSDYGVSRVDLAAPGVDILSTLPNNDYGYYSGTSQATPHVAGVVALVWSEHPDWSYRQVINQVLNTTDPVASLQGKVLTGGRLDAARAVGWSAPSPVPAPAPVPAKTTPRILGFVPSGVNPYTVSSVRLTFSEAIDASTFDATDVQLIGPNGQLIPLQSVRAVANSGNRQFDVAFATQMAVGTYNLAVGPNVRSQAGVSMDLYRSAFQINPLYTIGTSTPVAIPDVRTALSTLNVEQSFTIGRLTVRLDIAHTWDGDLYIHLQAPDGTDILLANRLGSSGHNYEGTVFDDRAAGSIRAGNAPFAGSYQPEAQLVNLVGKNAHGVWKLWVDDRAPGDSGVLKSWSLSFSAPDGISRIQSQHPLVPADGPHSASTDELRIASIERGPAAPSAVSAPMSIFDADASRDGAALIVVLDAVSQHGNALNFTANPPTQDAARQTADRVFASPQTMDRLAILRELRQHTACSETMSDEVTSALEEAEAEDV